MRNEIQITTGRYELSIIIERKTNVSNRKTKRSDEPTSSGPVNESKTHTSTESGGRGSRRETFRFFFLFDTKRCARTADDFGSLQSTNVDRQHKNRFVAPVRRLGPIDVPPRPHDLVTRTTRKRSSLFVNCDRVRCGQFRAGI